MFAVGFGDLRDLTELDASSSNPTADYEILIRSEREIGETPGLMLYNLKTRRCLVLTNFSEEVKTKSTVN